MDTEPLDLLSLDEAGEALGFKRLGYADPGEAVRALCRRRRLRYVKVGKRLMVRRLWLAEFIEGAAVAPVTRGLR